MYKATRILRTTYNVAGRHIGVGGDAMPLSPWEWFARLAHFVLLAGVTAVTVTALVIIASQSGATKATFLTNTFLSTYYTDNGTLAWAPPTDPADPTRLVDTFYACLSAAAVGSDASIGCTQKDLPTYQSCMQNTTASQAYRTAREKAYWKRVLNLITTEHVSYPEAQALQGVDIAAMVSAVQATYVADAAAGTTGVGRLIAMYQDQGLLSSQALLRITREATHIQGIAGCIKNVDLTAGVRHPLPAIYDQLWECTTGVVDTDAGQGRLFKKCTGLSPWPALDEMQTAYSTRFLGSYNRMFLLLVAAWILNSFLVYTLWVAPWNNYPNYTDVGKVETFWGATGPALTALCAVWNAAGLLLLIVPMAQTDGPISLTLQTIYVAVVLLLAATAYFTWNLLERPTQQGDEDYQTMQAAPAPVRYAALPTKGYARPAGVIVVKDQDGQQIISTKTKSDPTPILTQAWSDAAVPTEALFVLAVLGLAKDVVTADVGRIFLSTLLGAVIQSVLVRALYEGYMYKGAGGTPIHRLAAFTVMASVWNGFSVWILVYKRYSADNTFAHSLIIAYVALTSVVPVCLWAIYFVLLDFGRPVGASVLSFDLTNSLYNVTRASFHLSVLIRCIFLAVILANTGTEDQQGLSDLFFQFTG